MYSVKQKRKIKAFIALKGQNQKDLLKELGISKSTLLDIYSGRLQGQTEGSKTRIAIDRLQEILSKPLQEVTESSVA